MTFIIIFFVYEFSLHHLEEKMLEKEKYDEHQPLEFNLHINGVLHQKEYKNKLENVINSMPNIPETIIEQRERDFYRYMNYLREEEKRLQREEQKWQREHANEQIYPGGPTYAQMDDSFGAWQRKHGYDDSDYDDYDGGFDPGIG